MGLRGGAGVGQAWERQWCQGSGKMQAVQRAGLAGQRRLRREANSFVAGAGGSWLAGRAHLRDCRESSSRDHSSSICRTVRSQSG